MVVAAEPFWGSSQSGSGTSGTLGSESGDNGGRDTSAPSQHLQTPGDVQAQTLYRVSFCVSAFVTEGAWSCPATLL